MEKTKMAKPRRNIQVNTNGKFKRDKEKEGEESGLKGTQKGRGANCENHLYRKNLSWINAETWTRKKSQRKTKKAPLDWDVKAKIRRKYEGKATTSPGISEFQTNNKRQNEI